MIAPAPRTARERIERVGAIARRTASRYPLVGAVTVVGTALAIGYAMARPRVYKSETLILYREGIRAADVIGGETVGDPARKLGMRLKEMVFSRTSLQQIIEEKKLYPRLVEDRGYVDAVDEMRNHIAFRIRDGDTFGLSFEGGDPKLVQAVTAKLADALVDENSKNRTEQVTSTKDFLDAEKLRTEQELKAKETALAQFLAGHPEFARESVSGAVGTSIRAERSKKAADRKAGDPETSALERQAMRIERRLGAPARTVDRTPGGGGSRAGGAIDPRVTEARDEAERELRAAQGDLTDKMNRFKETYPDVVAAKARVKQAEQKLSRAQTAIDAERTFGEAEAAGAGAAPPATGADAEKLRADLAKINAEIAASRTRRRVAAVGAPEPGTAADANRIVALETDWNRLNRDVTDARERQKQVEERQFRAAMAAKSLSSGKSQMVVVDPAYLPTHPDRGGRSVIAGAGAVASFVVGLLLALGLALIDDRIFDGGDVLRAGVGEVLCVVPPTATGWTARRRRRAAHG